MSTPVRRYVTFSDKGWGLIMAKIEILQWRVY